MSDCDRETVTKAQSTGPVIRFSIIAATLKIVFL